MATTTRLLVLLAVGTLALSSSGCRSFCGGYCESHHVAATGSDEGPVAIWIEKQNGGVSIEVNPPSLPILYPPSDKTPSQAAWYLNFGIGAEGLVDEVVIEVKPAESPNKTLFDPSYTLSTSVRKRLSGFPKRAPVWGSNGTADWSYSVIAKKSGVEVARLDPQIIIRK